MKSIFKTFVLSLLIIAQMHFAYAQTASILPPAKTTFVDQNGKPLTSGTVDFYIPSTTTRKATWQDAAETILNTNPVVLDAAGRGLILGSGSYRQVVKDRLGNIIWDQVTSSAGSGGGGNNGDGLPVGSVIPWSGFSVPNGNYAFTYGQELSRTTYSELFLKVTLTQNVVCTSGSATLASVSDTSQLNIGAKVEASCIPANSVIVSKTASTVTLNNLATVSTSATAVFFPYGNGNATTTFNVPDYRGVVLPGRCNMGGSNCSVIFNPIYTDPNAIYGTGGGQSVTLAIPNLPAYTPTGAVSITDPGHNHTVTSGGATVLVASTPNVNVALPSSENTSTSTTGITAAFVGNAQGGTSTPIRTIQPSKTTNYIIKILADQPSTAIAIIVGTTQITNGSNTNVIYNNNGIVGEYALATLPDMYAGTANNKLVTPSVIWPPEVVVTYGTTTTFNMSTFRDAAVTLTGNITTMTVTGVVVGKSGTITFIQDGTGSRTTVWSSTFKFAGGVVPVLTTTAGAVDILSYSCRTATFCFAAMMNDVK